VFRTYPAPKQSWRAWKVSLDNRHHHKLRAAGFVIIPVAPGKHNVSVRTRSGRTKSLEVNATDGRTTWILAGDRPASTDLWNEDLGGPFVRCCTSREALPRSSIPLTSPSGRRQSLRVGRRNAKLALSLLVLVNLAIVAGAILLFALGTSGGHAIGGFILLVVAAFLAWKLRPGFRLLRNQRGWPLEDWRVDRHGDEQKEWQRWTTPEGGLHGET